MLVLTRRLNERIVVGDDIILEVVQIDRGKIRLAITAPRDVKIMREEIMDRPENPPTMAKVLAARLGPDGCCERHRARQACGCLDEARAREKEVAR